MLSFWWLPLLLIPIAALPAFAVWWQGRRLARYAADEDAVLAERMLGVQRRTLFVMTTATVLLMLVGAQHAIWTLPLMVVLSQAADYPARRKIHGETWSLAAYFSFTIRMMTALGGFWLLLAAAPWLMHLAGAAALPVAVVVSGLLLVWNARFQDVFLSLMKARPFEGAALAPAFAAVVSRSAVPMPRVWHSDPRGGLVPAAFALPSRRGGAVLFLQPLLDRLPANEIVAIFAHEVAHLEQFTRSVLRRIGIVTVGVIAAAVLVVPAVTALDPVWVPAAALVWPVLVLLMMVYRARAYQPLELAGDRRAAELCGDPEAVASALVRLYALTRMPRRLDVDVERWASHPSLSRRVQALRAMSAGGAPAGLDEPVSVAAADRSRLLTFEGEGLRLSAIGSGPDGATGAVLSSEFLRYSDLHELRLEFRGRVPAVVARERNGRIVRTDIAEEEAARVHDVLNRVDVLLAPELPGASAASWGRIAAGAAAVVALFSPASIVSVLVAAAPAMFEPSRVTLAAAGTAGATAGVWLVLTAGLSSWPVTAPALAALGAAAAWLAGRVPAEPADRRRRLVLMVVVGLLGVAAAVAWTVALVLPGASAWRLHQAALNSSALVVLPFALAAALVVSGSRVARLSAVLAAAVGLTAIAAASDRFVSVAVSDPLIQPGPALAPQEGVVTTRRSVTLPVESGDIQVSSDGRWVSTVLFDESESAERMHFVLTSVDGVTLGIAGEALAFAGDDRVLIANETEDAVALSLRRLESGLPEEWSIALPRMPLLSLAVSAPERRWQISGWNEQNDAVRLEGRLMEASWEEHRWRNPDEKTYSLWFAGSGAYALWLGQWTTPTFWEMFGPALAGRALDGGSNRLTIASAAGEMIPIGSQLRLTCVPPPIGREGVACAAFDGRSTRIYRIAAGVRPIARVPGRMWLAAEDEDGTLVGISDGAHLLIRPESGQMLRIDPVDGDWSGLAYAAGHIARGPFQEEGGRVDLGHLP